MKLHLAIFVVGITATSTLSAQGLRLTTSEENAGKSVTRLKSTFGAGGSFKSPFSWRNRLPTPGDQGKTNSCVGWCLSYGLMTFASDEITTEPFSPYYNYRWSLEIDSGWTIKKDGKWDDVGVSFASGFAALSSQGSCLQSEYDARPLPNGIIYMEPVPPPGSLVSGAFERRIDFNQSIIAAANMKFNIKKELNSGKVLPGAFRIHEGFREGKNFDRLPGGVKKAVWRQAAPGPKELHAMLITGYDDELGAFEVLNSFGSSFGDDGFVWIDYDLLTDQGQSETDRRDNPCCVVVYTYDAEHEVSGDNFDHQFREGETSGWMRLIDKDGVRNFVREDDWPIGSAKDIQVGDRVKLEGGAARRLGVRAYVVGDERRATSSGPRIAVLERGDLIKVEDMTKVLLPSGRNEYWISGSLLK